MLTNKAIAVAALAALVEQATAFNSHRHLHHQLDKRALETEWTTVWETVYITAGDEAIPAPTADVPADVPSKPDVDAPPPPPAPTTSSVTSTSTIVVAPTTTSEPVQQNEAAPAPQLTTLVTAVKPPAEETTSAAPTTTEAAAAEDTSVAPVLNPIQPEPTTSSVESTTSAPEETSSPSPPSGSPVSSKRGLAFNDASLANTFGSSCKACSWAYNWDSSRGDLSSDLEYVPMLWNDQPLHTDRWEENVETELANGAKALFSFNEPDHATQANISPEQAAASHIQWLNKYSGRALIGAPAVTNSGNPGEGLEWLQGFVDACKASSEGCNFDFCNVHWYSEAQYADTLFEHLQKAHDICGKPVWLTEFAPLGSDDQISEFMTNIIPELDNVEYLEAYSYFMVSAGSLMSSTTSLSGYGQIYASV
jgi:hypothetical protein